jgi:hypothetical protein
MALNPFFLQGSSEEQRLLQSLINEQLKIYGVEVTYLPRKLIKEDTLFTELQSSVFNDNFSIEAYVNTYEGYGGAGDILTKFDIALKDELVITISQERFEDFIAPFLEDLPDNEIKISNRPREGDLVYFPLGKRIFEVKFVEHEKPFYQLGKNYVYELRCELFEYEDEMGGWDVQSQITEEIDGVLETQGFITTLKLISIGSTASVGVTTSTGYIRKISLTNDGYGYTKVPTVSISTAPSGGTNATAVAITTAINNVYSVKEILLTNPGAGYTVVPSVSIVSVGETITGVGYTTYGVGAAATATLVTSSAGINGVTITSGGSGYPSPPILTFTTPTSGIGTAFGRVSVTTDNVVDKVFISDAGIGYTSGTATAIISNPPIITGIGTFQYNEEVTGSISGAKARVKTWDATTNTLKVGTTDGDFLASDVIVGTSSSARYSVDYIETAEFSDKYDKSDEIEEEADLIIDFSESNPFGNY